MKVLQSVVLLSLVLFVGCQDYDLEKDVELQQLKTWMSGSFNSAEQAEADTNFFHINLEMKPIWTERDDAIYLYVEQAAAWAMERPYRQRVYKLSRTEEGGIQSAVYLIEAPLRFAGAWQDEAPLASLTPDSLSEKEGCAIHLKWEENRFAGSTREKDCPSQLRGAGYATSEVVIEEHVLTSWDRGFDANDEHIWGAVTGPYIFKKVRTDQ